MKKLISVSFLSFFLFMGTQVVKAQMYSDALGLGIDLGDGATLVGPQYKHFFGGENAVNAQALFGNHLTVVGVDYSFNQRFAGSSLGWYVGVGPQLAFADGGGSAFAIRPAVGLEYKIPTVPLGFHFDWKPWWNLSNGSNMEAGRFSLGMKYILK